MTSSSKKQEVEKALLNLMEQQPDTTGAIVMTYSGELIADSLSNDVNSEKIRIGVRNYTAATHRYLDELDKAEMVKQSVSKFANGYIVIYRENQSLLMVTTTKAIKLGLVFYDMRNSAEKIDKIISNK